MEGRISNITSIKGSNNINEIIDSTISLVDKKDENLDNNEILMSENNNNINNEEINDNKNMDNIDNINNEK